MAKVDKYPPQPSAEPIKSSRHDHVWRGFRGGGISTQMCVVCGKAKDTEVLEEQAPSPEPVEVKPE